MKWKSDFMELAGRIEKLLDNHPPSCRVLALLHQYGKVTRALLYAQVNGGLDECYMEFPDAPELVGCKHGERCYCDFLKERDDFIAAKGLREEFEAIRNPYT